MTDIVFGLAADAPGNVGPIFAARESGVVRSDDGGGGWELVLGRGDGPLAGAATAVAVSPGFAVDRTVYAGGPGQVLRSTDGGRSWTSSGLAAPPSTVVDFLVLPRQGDQVTVLAATLEDGVLVSPDGGATWSDWSFGLVDMRAYCLAAVTGPDGRPTVFVGTATGLFESTTGGRSWRGVETPAGPAAVLSLAAVGARLYLGTETEGLYASGDRGASWTRLPIQQDGPVNALDARADTGEDVDTILVAAGRHLLLSPDAGRSWRRAAPRPMDRGIVSMLAPCGLGPLDPILVGLEDGRLLSVPVGMPLGEAHPAP